MVQRHRRGAGDVSTVLLRDNQDRLLVRCRCRGHLGPSTSGAGDLLRRRQRCVTTVVAAGIGRNLPKFRTDGGRRRDSRTPRWRFTSFATTVVPTWWPECWPAAAVLLTRRPLLGALAASAIHLGRLDAWIRRRNYPMWDSSEQRPALRRRGAHLRWAAYWDLVILNSTTLVWPVIGTTTPGDLKVALLPSTRTK